MTKPFALIVEDHEHTATIFEAALQTAGYDTQVINDGLIAQTKIQEITPDVVVLDLHLPNVTGEELMYQIREDERLTQTRIILASADPLLAAELESEVDLILIKPISFDQLSILSKRLRPSTKI